MMKVPYVNLPAQHAPIKTALLEAVGRVLDHGQFILGPEVAEFERAFADLCGTRFAIGVNSGTDALILALRAIGVGPGDEVITPAHSFIASASCIALVGARPVLADVRDDLNLDPDRVAAAITPRTKAILVVHLTGRPADLDPLMEIADRHGLTVIEDAAQSVLARYRGRPVGSFGAIGCFSLHPLKTLNACGDGGVLTTNDPDLADRLRVLRNIGLRTRDDAVEWSGNSRLDTLQAALLLVKLKQVEEWTARRRANAAYYRDRLARWVGVPVDRPDEWAVYHTFVIQADRRDDLKASLERAGIGTAVHYPIPIHLTTVGARLGHGPASFPVAERLARTMLSLPVYPELTPTQLEYVAASIAAFYQTGA